MAVVADLGAQGASGVLEVKGDPSGAIYLDGGQIAFAGASWVPGLIPRLSGLRPSAAGLQRLLAEREAEDAAVAARAVQQGCLTAAGLHQLIRSIVVDAFLVLVVPLAVNSPVHYVRFTSTRTYWTDLFPRLDIDSVRREAVGRAEVIAQYGLAPTTAVALRELRRPSAVLTREQWAVASQIMEKCRPAPSRAAARGPAPTGHEPTAPTAVADQAPSADVLRQVLAGLRKLS